MIEPLSDLPAQTDASPVSPNKATFYLKGNTIEQLDTLWTDTRRSVGRSRRTQITKSLLVQIALDQLTVVMEKMTPAERLAYLGLQPE